jgi:pimeloyl-ACP methyl ester carboxylesterase
MTAKVLRTELTLPYFTVNALAFIPSPDGVAPVRTEWAFFSHGYTSHKGDCLNWATRLVEAGVPCIIFDQPGHYLGSFQEASSLEDFKAHAHELFGEAFTRLTLLMEQVLGLGNFLACSGVILGGHSLGGYTSLRALELPIFKDLRRIGVAIGVGLAQRQAAHLFETAFYEKTLSIRRQLVSDALDSRAIFAWLKEEKMNMTLSNQRVHLIVGEDDVVVGPGGLEAFENVLKANGNEVSVERPKKLAHHEPGAASPHIYSFLKKHFGWN